MEHQFEDRLALAPYVGSNIKLIGVVIRINSILYDRYKDHKQVVVASVYDIEHDIQLDHINLMLRVSQANKLYLYEPISFCGKVTKYLARHHLSELDNMVVYKKTYGIAHCKAIQKISNIPVDKLSKWSESRILNSDFDINKYRELPNDGTREHQIISDIRKTKIKELLQ